MPRLALAFLAAAAALSFGVSDAGAQNNAAGVGLDGHRHDTVRLYCSAPSDATCYFVILRAKGGVLPVKLQGQTTTTRDDLEVGRDYFVATINVPAPMSLSVCRSQETDNPPCHWGLLKIATNEVSH